MPNSESPISQQAIDAETAMLTSVNTAMDDGNLALNSLLQALGGNPAGDTISGAQGVPTTGTLDTSLPGIPVVPQPASAPPQSLLPDVTDPGFWAWQNSPIGGPSAVGGGWPGYSRPGAPNFPGPVPARSNGNARRSAGKNAARYGNVAMGGNVGGNQTPPSNCPVVVPLVTAIPIPQTSAPVSVPAAASASTPAAPVSVPDCRTGNICLDLMNGCVLSSQVDPQQLLACSKAGYAGNRNLYPAVAAAGGAGGGAYLGFPDPNPAPYVAGMSGLGQDSTVQDQNASLFGNVLEYVIGGIATAAALAILWKRK